MDGSKPLDHPFVIAKNTIYNLFGYGAPLVVACFSIPLIINRLGADRFGILSLAWALMGYMGLLDLGLGRALTKIIAEKLGHGFIDEIPSTVWTGLCALLITSLLVGLIFGACSHWMVYTLLEIPSALELETFRACLLLAAFIPIVIISVALRGILEAYQRFDLVNMVRIPHGIYSFLAPLFVIPFTRNLFFVIGSVLLGRVAIAWVQFVFCIRIIPNLFVDIGIKPLVFKELLHFGSWMTVTNAIGPLLVYLDRFFIGTLVSMSAVAFYATPSEILTKLTLLSAAFMNVIFPAISASFASNRLKSAKLLSKGMKYVFMAVLPLALLTMAFSPEGIKLWLDEQFLKNSLGVTRVLTIGILFMCIGQIPYAFIQGAGRPDLTGKLHLYQLPPYIAALSVAITHAGILGAAIVWTLRASVETFCMYALSQKILEKDKLPHTYKGAVIIAAALVSLISGAFGSLKYRTLYFLLSILFWGWVFLKYLLSIEEKEFLYRKTKLILKLK